MSMYKSDDWSRDGCSECGDDDSIRQPMMVMDGDGEEMQVCLRQL